MKSAARADRDGEGRAEEAGKEGGGRRAALPPDTIFVGLKLILI